VEPLEHRSLFPLLDFAKDPEGESSSRSSAKSRRSEGRRSREGEEGRGALSLCAEACGRVQMWRRYKTRRDERERTMKGLRGARLRRRRKKTRVLE